MQMHERPDQIRRARRNERGSVLILVLLLMLALSAIGMVALESVTQSVQRSGLYRVRTTSHGFSDAAANFLMRYSANKTGKIQSAMVQGTGCLQALDGDRDPNTELNHNAWRDLRKRMGGCVRYRNSDTTNSFEDVISAAGSESGLFTDGTHGSFERRMDNTEFEIVVRYPFPAQPPSGEGGDKRCYKMVTVATQGTMGEVDAAWDDPQQVGRGRTIFKGRIGPFSCQ